jgi:hypothetical protein
MKVAILLTSHAQTLEWEINAEFFKRMPKNSILRNADMLAYVNSTDIKASEAEKYLKSFPNPKKYLLYTPLNGHTVANLPIDAKTNKYKTNSSNRAGYLFGAIEAYTRTFDLLRDYDYVVQINTDVYITDFNKIENYLCENFNNENVFHVNTMRGDINKGFTCDTIIYRPNIMKNNVFQYCQSPEVMGFVLEKSNIEPDFKFIPEQILKRLCEVLNLKYKVICPGTRNNRTIDAFGLWHCHDISAAKDELKSK